MYKLVQEQLMPLNDTSAHLLQVFTFQTFLVIIKLDTTTCRLNMIQFDEKTTDDRMIRTT